MARWAEEDGAATIFVVGLATALLMLAGLLFDGGRILSARREAFHTADNAARAAAQAVDIEAVRSGAAPLLDVADAEVAAREYLERLGLDGEVLVTADQVSVTVSIDVEMALLQAIGLNGRTVTGTGRAQIVEGVSRAGG
jgi:Flp pilus assembly protein TadG